MKRFLFIFSLMLAGLEAAGQEWASSQPGYRYDFPRDHGQHPEFKIEWWYFTGNLQSEKGRRFGYQLTFFRIGAVAQPATKSPWALRDVWMAHFAISDIEGRRYHSADRLNRAGPGLAGATTKRIWNEDWACQIIDSSTFEIHGAEGDLALSLRLHDPRPPVIHGLDGISQKGPTTGNASHYYSLTRLASRGTVKVGGEVFSVAGESWMDHEFGTSFLEAGQQGWDWFSAQLNDGSALMLFQLRSTDQAATESSAGTLVLPDGQVVPLEGKDFRLESLKTTAGYPVVWNLEVPGHGIRLRCSSLLDQQEFQAKATPGLLYWEGAVEYEGTRAGQAVRGHGYLEMTGYKGGSMARWFGVGD